MLRKSSPVDCLLLLYILCADSHAHTSNDHPCQWEAVMECLGLRQYKTDLESRNKCVCVCAEEEE